MDKILETASGIQFTTGTALLELSYLVAALLFVWGLKLLSHPETARRGNLWAAGGMGLAMVTTLFLHKDANGAGIGIGAAIGWIIARKVQMTAMPQLVSLYNATGGAASALVALLEYPNAVAGNVTSIIVTTLGLVIGAVAFSGSILAYGKLDGKIKDFAKPFMTYFNLLLLLATFGFAIYLAFASETIVPAENVGYFTFECLYRCCGCYGRIYLQQQSDDFGRYFSRCCRIDFDFVDV